MPRAPGTQGFLHRLRRGREGDGAPLLRYQLRQWRSLLWPETLEGRIAVSAVVHGVAVFLIFNGWWLGARRLKPAGSATGSHVLVTYHPGKAAPPSPQHRPKLTRQLSKSVPPPPTQDEADKVPAVQGNDALGSGTVSIAHVQAFPGQRPDLSGAGATGDVVVDVEIDDTGHVAQVHARRGMGAGIDDMVVATVGRWVFYPAMRNGHAVSSERELHFHFDRRRDANCGWECFALEAQ